MLFFSAVARNARAATIRGGLFAVQRRLLVTVTCDDDFSGLSLTKSKPNTSASTSTSMTNIFRDSHAHGAYNNNSHSQLLLSLSHPRCFSSNSSQSQSTSQSTGEDNGSGSGSPAGTGATAGSGPTGSCLVWFLLVDEEGNAFKGAGLDRIKLAKDADVVDFRDALKTKYSDSHLKGVAPSDLQVYANKAAFKTKQKRKQKRPLEADAPISGLGSSTKKVIYVVVPPAVQEQAVEVPSAPVALPMGPQVDLRSCSCDNLLTFLESEMTNKDAIVSSPHILRKQSLQFTLVGREDAIKIAEMCFNDIIAGSAPDRTQYPIPVCSGISGLGKTRMLEEGKELLLKRMKLGLNNCESVIVPYFNGYNPQAVEKAMCIEASFSWRLLFRFFLDKNCPFTFQEWFASRLPRNGGQLTLQHAVNCIYQKLCQVRQVQEGSVPFYLFLGIDEYQKIETIGSLPKNENTTILRELVEVIGGFLCSNWSRKLVLLPMFAGTDLGVIASGSIAKSSYYVTRRLPMTLLTMNEVVKLVESNEGFTKLLRNSQVCRNLFYLGGVPRWIVDYLSNVKTLWEKDQSETVSLEIITKCYTEIRMSYVESYLDALDISDRVRLAAFAVSGMKVEQNAMFNAKWKWSRLRDSSLCLLVDSSDGQGFEVRVPYSLLQNVGTLHKTFQNEAEKAFALALNDLHEHVDTVMFDVTPWQAWEKFGAYFYAVRINALLVLEESDVSLGTLLCGALMDDATRDIRVLLKPSRVFLCQDAFGADTCQLISEKNNPLRQVDWISNGYIVMNGDYGAGVDIFFALLDASTSAQVVFLDQRKRQNGKFQPSHAEKYLSKMDRCPRFLQEGGALFVRGVMNCVATSGLTTFTVPPKCFLVSREQSDRFHGSLAYHPACSPIISINSANQTALKTLFRGSTKEVDQVVEAILKKRKEPDGGFSSRKQITKFVHEKKFKVEFINDLDDYADFSA